MPDFFCFFFHFLISVDVGLLFGKVCIILISKYLKTFGDSSLKLDIHILGKNNYDFINVILIKK